MAMDLLGNNFGSFIQQTVGASKQSQAQRIEKQEDDKQRIQQEDKDKAKEAEKKEVKDTYTNTARQEQSAPRLQRRMEEVLRHFVGGDNKNVNKFKDEKEKLEKLSKEAREEAQEAMNNAKMGHVDNAARISLLFNSHMKKQEAKKKADHKQDNHSAAQMQHNRLKKFVANMSRLVKQELDQYSKATVPYDRRNLREIAQALGHEIKSFDNKTKKFRDDVQKGVADAGKKCTQFFANRLEKELKWLKPEEVNDSNVEPMDYIV
jgi:hypothetical protein